MERVAESNDFGAIGALVSSTRDEEGNASLASNERIGGSSILRDIFTNLPPPGDGDSRFSSGGTDRVFYAASDLETAIAETKYHLERRMRQRARRYEIQFGMQVYMFDLDGEFHDLRGQRVQQPLIYHEDNYRDAQDLAQMVREAGSNDGIAYDSVRRQGGECVAVFRPHVLSNERQERRLRYVWNGESIEVNEDSGEAE